MPVLPPDVSESEFTRALKAFADVVGEQWVLASDLDRQTYLDGFALAEPDAMMPAGAISPASVEEIQAILRIANEYRIPLWPVSTGKNLAYGGSNPRMRGTMVLDLIRMNRVLEVNENLGYAVVEPGVSYFDMDRHLTEMDSTLWMSLPAPGWGSLMGNALDRGIGYTDYGEHANNICGMEVVLANGDVIRTGMGAQAGNKAWHLYKYGYGPSWDQVFLQSGMGIVTKMGMWLKPEPAAAASITVNLQNEEDLVPAVEVMRPLRLRNIIDSNATIASPIRRSALGSMQSDWYDGEGHMPREALEAMIEKQGFGWWGVRININDESPALIDERLKLIRPGFEAIPGAEISVSRWDRDTGEGEPPKPTPGLNVFQMLNWRGGPGGHVDFSPVVPTTGANARELYELASSRFYKYGFDYFGGFTFMQRHMINTSVIIYNKDDADMRDAVMDLFNELVAESGKLGYGGYRTHLSFMDQMAEQFDFNDHALMRFNERMKAAADPNGILAPGKSGIWPAQYKSEEEGRG